MSLQNLSFGFSGSLHISTPAQVGVNQDASDTLLHISCRQCSPCVDQNMLQWGVVAPPRSLWDTTDYQTAQATWNACWADNETVQIQIPKTLRDVQNNGSSNVIVDPRVLGSGVTVHNTGSGELTVQGSLPSTAQNQVQNTGSGSINILGALGRAQLSNTGSGRLTLAGAATDILDASITGSGGITITQPGQLRYNISGSGSLTCREPSTDLSGQHSGSGSVSGCGSPSHQTPAHFPLSWRR